MIRVDRPHAPDFFRSKEYKRLQNELEAYFGEVTQKKRQSTFDWDRQGEALGRKDVRQYLAEVFRSKCAYCESPISPDSHPEVGHFRPRRGTQGLAPNKTKGGEAKIYHDRHYWWLSLKWNNLLLMCQQCSRFKSSWFPLANEAKRAALPGVDGPALGDEKPLLLDPCRDDPGRHLRFLQNGIVESLTRRGKVTIDLIQLNRSELVAGRESAVSQIRQLLLTIPRGNVEDFLGNLMGPDATMPYVAAQRQAAWDAAEADQEVSVVLQELAQELGINWEAMGSPYEAPEKLAEEMGVEPRLDVGRLALERIELHNFRNIADLTIEVPQTSEGSRAPWILFLGENAVGKSTILQAIVLTLMGDDDRIEATGIRPEAVLRYYKEHGELRRCKEGYVRIWVSGVELPLELSFKDGASEFHGNVSAPGTYLLAYGPTRLLPDVDHTSVESPGRVRVSNLFKPFLPLRDASHWLFDLWEKDKGQHEDHDTPYNLIVRGLRQMLLMKGNESIEPDLLEPEKRRILIELKNETTTLDNLSDGYRTILALAADLMYMLYREGTSMSEAEGIVIIDEIGSNLHPGWKKRIVSCFREVFPKIQFIVTTHEPLCLRGLYEQETVLLRRDYQEQIVAVTNLPNPNDLRVDELLASEFFGLSSTLESDVEEIYAEYYKLLTVPRPKKSQRERMLVLKEELRAREHLGHGLRDELMYEVIDKLIADHLRNRRPKHRSDLKKETVSRVLQAWQESGLYDDYLETSDS